MKRSRASVVLGVLSTVLVVLLVGAATERTSPGRIASVHGRIAELDGGQACAKCHGGWFGDMQGACLDCHPAIAKQLAERRGLHGTLPPAQAGHCAECHGEHHGDAFRLVNKLAFAQAGVPDPQRFDHARVGYTMAGAHLALTCAECHPHADAELVPEGAQRFLGLRQDCASCHGDPHQGRMRFACTTCHDQIAFEAIVVPGHEQWLPLDGAHVAVGCRQCHVAGSPHALEALQPGRHQQARQCADCHAAPHGQPFLLGNAGDAGVAPAAVCAQCHRLDLPRFADLRVTVTPAQHAHGGFPLQAPHAGLVCAVCHLPGASYAERHPGRGPDDCAACHGDAHGGQFATGPFAAAGCRGCHAATHWTPHEFDLAHHARTALPLEGRHATGACNGCHAEPPAGEPRRFRGTPHRCEACHDDAHRGAFAHAEAKLQAAPRGSCALCHGAEAFATLAHDRFDHRDWTGFPLDGAHAQIECTDCHARTETPDQFGRRFGRVHGTIGAATDCTTCHGDPHRGTFATGALPALVDGRESCLRCHDTASFRALPHGFDHAAATGFALSGAHAELACRACHPALPQADAEGRTWQGAAGRACADCHRDPHAGQFVRLGTTDCSRCHKSQTSFGTVTFRHNLDSRFPLGEQHAKLPCASCHRPESIGGGETIRYKPLPTDCVGCHGREEGGAPFRRRRGMENVIAAHQGLFADTAADYGWRAVEDPTHVHDPLNEGKIGRLLEAPVWSSRSTQGPEFLFRNPDFSAANLVNDVDADGSVVTGSRLAKLYQEQVAFTCGDCHLGSSGANNRYGDFRPSGCSACHMPYSQDGRSRSQDPNVPKNEPLDPDDIDDPERAHVRSHRIRGVARTLSNGTTVQGIDDHTCAGCHQGSNRMVMQYWGIRLDQNQDVRRGVQYPANPVTFRTTRDDTRLFDPAVGNRTFNGRNHNQYLLFEDYDGDGRDDTPADVHYEAGMGCVDCHGSVDLHGNVQAPNGGDIVSRMGHAITIRCEDCHGTATAYANTVTGENYARQTATLGVDSEGNPLRHVERDSAGDFWLTSKLDGRRHYIRQVRDVIVNSGKTHPTTGEAIYTAMGSFAMGRDDGDPATGIGSQQTGGPHGGFSHLDSMNCAACHSSWSNSCIGCHLEGEYNEGNNFSNITGERIVFRQRFAEFVYQSPVPFFLGIGTDNKVRTSATNTKVFFRYRDLNGDRTPVFAFTDRNGGGANRQARPYPSLGHNAFLAHSIRGRVSPTAEGPRYCVSCHLTDNSVANWSAQYQQFRTTLYTNDFANLDWQLLKQHIGQNPGNQLDSPFFVHMVAGLGTGLWLFDQNGAAQNPLDQDANRYGSDGVAPAAQFNPAAVRYDLDRVVDPTGVSNGSSNQALDLPVLGPNRRDGAVDPALAGPLGTTLAIRLADPGTGIVLNSWVDANRTPQGGAATILNQ